MVILRTIMRYCTKYNLVIFIKIEVLSSTVKFRRFKRTRGLMLFNVPKCSFKSPEFNSGGRNFNFYENYKIIFCTFFDKFEYDKWGYIKKNTIAGYDVRIAKILMLI